MSVIQHKEYLRNEMLNRRNILNRTEKYKYDKWICEALLNQIETYNIKTIHTYLPMGTEIDIFPLINTLLSKSITVITPKTLKKRRLKHLKLQSLDQLETGKYGTSHPANSTEYTESYDLIIVPGLAFDSQNYRIGYGGGYYDTFLSEHPSATTIGLCYPFQRIDIVPIEKHDIQLDKILSM